MYRFNVIIPYILLILLYCNHVSSGSLLQLTNTFVSFQVLEFIDWFRRNNPNSRITERSTEQRCRRCIVMSFHTRYLLCIKHPSLIYILFSTIRWLGLFLQKAKGDVKLKGKPDPYAYVPLDFRKLNKRYTSRNTIVCSTYCDFLFVCSRKSAKLKGQFHGLMSAASKGVQRANRLSRTKAHVRQKHSRKSKMHVV